VLWLVIQRCWPLLKRKPREYRVLLSHDVDRPLSTTGRSAYRVARSLAADVVKRRDLGLAARRVRAYMRARRGVILEDPCDTFDFIMTESERRGWRSAFYFMAGGDEPGIDETTTSARRGCVVSSAASADASMNSAFTPVTGRTGIP